MQDTEIDSNSLSGKQSDISFDKEEYLDVISCETNFTMEIEKENGRKIIGFGYSAPTNHSYFDKFSVYYDNRTCTTFRIKREIEY